MIYAEKITKYLPTSKAILGIGLIAIGLGAISKKVISYPTGGCIKENNELTLNNVVKSYLFDV